MRKRSLWCARSTLPNDLLRKGGLEPGFPVLREAVSAIDGPALGGLEGDFALFSTV
jgi:hypothetical protein